MKEKEFEVIVPAYDALESELEDILGGAGCNGKCNLTINCPSYGGGGSSCVPRGNYAQDPHDCCPGLIGIPAANGVFLCVQA